MSYGERQEVVWLLAIADLMHRCSHALGEGTEVGDWAADQSAQLYRHARYRSQGHRQDPGGLRLVHSSSPSPRRTGEDPR